MNNYASPYFIGQPNQNMNPYAYQPFNYQQQPQVQQPPQQSNSNHTNYDFHGNFVTSYEQVKTSPFNDKTMVYLDTANDKMYIKRISDKGIPETQVFGLTAVEKNENNNINTTTNTTQQKSNIENELKTLQKKYDTEIEALKKQINDLKVKGGK